MKRHSDRWMVDLHFHLLPGIDDGPEDVAASVALAHAAAEAGVTTIVATPHVDHTYGVQPQVIADRVTALVDTPQMRELGIRVVAGAEVAVTRALELSDAELDAATIGDGPWILLECPLSWENVLEMGVSRLRARGNEVVLAHPERSPGIVRNPDRLERLVAQGCLASITDASLRGRFGGPVREAALTFLERGLVHNVTSDAHHATQRAPGLREGLEDAAQDLPGVQELAAWMTSEVPEALIAGAPLPARPNVELKRRRRWRLFAR